MDASAGSIGFCTVQYRQLESVNDGGDGKFLGTKHTDLFGSGTPTALSSQGRSHCTAQAPKYVRYVRFSVLLNVTSLATVTA
jgi:hypothetical protein